MLRVVVHRAPKPTNRRLRMPQTGLQRSEYKAQDVGFGRLTKLLEHIDQNFARSLCRGVKELESLFILAKSRQAPRHAHLGRRLDGQQQTGLISVKGLLP